jgi:hypothetical protein
MTPEYAAAEERRMRIAAEMFAAAADHRLDEATRALYLTHARRWSGTPRHRHEDTAPPTEPRRDLHDVRRAAYAAAREAWQATPKHERRRLALDTLGDAALTVRELLDRMRAAAPELADALHESNTRRLLTDLVTRGEVHREGERWKNRTRYRYRRAAELRGPIADLDRQFP